MPGAPWVGHYRQEDSVTELSDTAISFPCPPHPPSCHREAPSTTLPCFPSPGLSVIASFQLSTILLLFITDNSHCSSTRSHRQHFQPCPPSVSQQEKENSVGELGLSRNRGPEMLRSTQDIIYPSCPIEIGNSLAQQDAAHVSSFLLSSCSCSFNYLFSERQNTFYTSLHTTPIFL